MTEKQWLKSGDPMEMLAYIKAVPNTRKVLLLTAACCHRVLSLLPDYVKGWVQGVEDVAEGRLGVERLNDDWEATEMFLACNDENGRCYAVINIAANAWQEWDSYAPGNAAWKAERKPHASLIRDIFGNPFRPITLNPAWMSSTVRNIADSIYTDRGFNKMPILGDALEDAGCSNPNILDHCRSGQDHVRGCWVVDLVLGKE